MFNKSKIKSGILTGRVKFIPNPDTGAGTVCEMGNRHFEFGGDRAANITTWNYLMEVPLQDAVDAVYSALSAMLTSNPELCEHCDDVLDGRWQPPVEEKPVEEEETSENVHVCPFGGDIANDCADCAYSGDYFFDSVNGICARRPDGDGQVVEANVMAAVERSAS